MEKWIQESENLSDLYQGLQVLETEEAPLSEEERLQAINGPLLAWYAAHARDLPWRRSPDAYRVWISEIMLQQTRVEAVKPYYERFLEAFPDTGALAAAPQEQLLKLWEGLGYYSRAKNLQKAAMAVEEQYGGRLPADYEALLKLPGIGSYTAGAIASIAYGIAVPAVDGNVLRVISRVLASREDILKQTVRRKMEAALKKTMSQEQPGAYNQGLMEIGALICVPAGQPRCGQCPLASICLARRQKLWDSIPYKSPKKPRRMEERTILLVTCEDRIALEKRPETGLLASLYQFPNLEGRMTREEAEAWLRQKGCEDIRLQPAGEARHIFSHVEWHMTGYRAETSRLPQGYLEARIPEIREKYPVPNAFLAYTKQLNGES